jgi:hypothetical protein
MLVIIVPGQEVYDEERNEFSTINDVILELEQSLVSLSKWESKVNRPFLSSSDRTSEETLLYIYCMILTPNVSPNVLLSLTQANIETINEYIGSPQSATTFGDMPERKAKGEVITAELIYYWMVVFSIPFECQSWHLNRLFALIRICNLKQAKPKKMSRNEIAERYRRLNEQRRKELGTAG